MAITSSDIHNQSFSIDRKGYDVDEVDVFLEHVADEIDGLNDRIADLRSQLDEQSDRSRFDGFDTPAVVEDVEEEPAIDCTAQIAEKDELISSRNARIAELEARIAELEAEVADQKADGNAIAQALIIAQRSADDTVAAAKARAAQIVADAEDEADRILDDADEKCQQVFDEIKQLEEDREKSRADYQDMLKDFIGDATRRLAEIGDIPATRVPSAGHARAELVVQDDRTDRYAAAGQMPQRQETYLSATYATPQAGDVVVAAAAPRPTVVEKDLSGFGDADDEFELEDID